MTSDDIPRYGPLHASYGDRRHLAGEAFDTSKLKVTGIVAVCLREQPPSENTLPSISIRILQFARLEDESLVRLDMDRGFTAFRYGDEPKDEVSWNQDIRDVVDEVLTIVRSDTGDNSYPWDDLADAAQKRGILVRADALSKLPYQVLLAAEVAALFQS